MRECCPLLIMTLLDCVLGIECNSRLGFPNTNRPNRTSKHLQSMVWLQVYAPIISCFRRLLHLLCPLSLAASTLPSTHRHPHHRSWPPRLHRSLPRQNYPQHNRPCLQLWPHRRSFRSSVALSGKPSLPIHHRMEQIPMVLLRPGMRTKSNAS